MARSVGRYGNFVAAAPSFPRHCSATLSAARLAADNVAYNPGRYAKWGLKFIVIIMSSAYGARLKGKFYENKGLTKEK
jgi:hypothetical protein